MNLYSQIVQQTSTEMVGVDVFYEYCKLIHATTSGCLKKASATEASFCETTCAMCELFCQTNLRVRS